MDNRIYFIDKLRKLLKERNITTLRFEQDTLIDRNIFYDKKRRPHKSTLMAIAYYLKMDGEDLVDGTDAEDVWYS